MKLRITSDRNIHIEEECMKNHCNLRKKMRKRMWKKKINKKLLGTKIARGWDKNLIAAPVSIVCRFISATFSVKTFFLLFSGSTLAFFFFVFRFSICCFTFSFFRSSNDCVPNTMPNAWTKYNKMKTKKNRSKWSVETVTKE